jgi:hypothetical protein
LHNSVLESAVLSSCSRLSLVTGLDLFWFNLILSIRFHPTKPTLSTKQILSLKPTLSTTDPISETDHIHKTDPISKTDHIHKTNPIYKTDPIHKIDPISTIDLIHKIDPISKTDPIHKTKPPPFQHLARNPNSESKLKTVVTFASELESGPFSNRTELNFASDSF